MCTSPIHMRVDRRVLRVPCGRCCDCMNYKSTRNTVLAQLEAQHHRYTFFITPTYDMQSVPRAKVSFTTLRDGHLMRVYNVSPRMYCEFQDTDQLIYSKKITYKQYDKTLLLFRTNKFRYFGPYEFPYTTTSEFQKFIKRLRYYIMADGTIPFHERQDVRYFGTFEYGPQSFRPHGHILLYTSSEAIFRKIYYLVHKAWKYGTCTVALSKGDAAQYTAEYTTANSSLPALLQENPIRPRTFHSIGLGQEKRQIIDAPREDLHYAKIATRMFSNGSGIKYVSPSFSVESSLFPKCYRYTASTHIQRFNCYILLSTARRIFGKHRKIKDLARDLIVKYRFLSIPDKTALSWIYTPSPDGRSVTEETFRSILNTSSLFLKNCALLDMCPDEYLNSIEQYYIDKDASTLWKWYYERERRYIPSPDQVIYDYDNLDFNNEVLDYFNSEGRDPLPFFSEFHPLALSYLANTSGYYLQPGNMLRAWRDNFDTEHNILLTQKKSKAYTLSRHRLKHKELNDANHIFEY